MHSAAAGMPTALTQTHVAGTRFSVILLLLALTINCGGIRLGLAASFINASAGTMCSDFRELGRSSFPA